MIKASLKNKLEHLLARYYQLEKSLSEPEIIASQEKFRDLSKEYAQLEDVARAYLDYQKLSDNLQDVEELLNSTDLELRSLGETEKVELEEQLATLENTLQVLLLPKDPNDARNIFLEVRSGAGGDEAAIFAGELYRMYARYVERMGWEIEIVSCSEGEHGGYKEVIAKISGREVYSRLKFESGAHRVQRVPATEAQGRIHTSTCTVAVLPEVEAIDEIAINPADLRIETFRASGAGGQHVNRTESAIRITHLPSGLVVECQDDRSQHKNRARAMSLLSSRLLDLELSKQQKEQAAQRRNLVGTGDRSERIRTYNFPQGRVTDHRINLTLYKLDDIMDGSLNQIIIPLQQEHQADLLAQLNV